MDTAHSLLALIAVVALMKWYASCQLRYWCSPECRKEPKPKAVKLSKKHSLHLGRKR